MVTRSLFPLGSLKFYDANASAAVKFQASLKGGHPAPGRSTPQRAARTLESEQRVEGQKPHEEAGEAGQPLKKTVLVAFTAIFPGVDDGWLGDCVTRGATKKKRHQHGGEEGEAVPIRPRREGSSIAARRKRYAP